MKRRMGAACHTGLGGGGASLMTGESSKNKKFDKLINECSKDCYETFFKNTVLDDEGVDAGYDEFWDEVRIGIEPSYQFESLKMITINHNKDYSAFTTGKSFSDWGTGIRKTEKRYKDYKSNCKFVRFIDKWHPILYGKNKTR